MHLTFKQPWRDGTTAVVFDPVTFLGRLAVLVPRPRVNLLLYYGVLGARSAWRCGGRLRLVALIGQAAVIERILHHREEPLAIPRPRPARAPPEQLRQFAEFTD